MNSEPTQRPKSPQSALLLQDLQFAYSSGPPVIHIPQWEVATGESVFLRGPSGSGKSTLLGLIGGILAPTEGSLQVLGRDLVTMKPAARDIFRANHVGFIFQMFNLLPYLSVVENVTLPARFSTRRARNVSQQSVNDGALELLDRLGLSADFCSRPVTQLSVGQQQRAAAARALLGQPGLLIADEPTSALDADNREQFIAVLLSEARAAGSTVLFVSHDPALAVHFDRRVDLHDINQAGISP